MSVAPATETTPQASLSVVKTEDLEIDFQQHVLSATVNNEGRPADEAPDEQDYENELNALAVSISRGVDIDDRRLFGLLKKNHPERFKALILHKLRTQAADGEQINVGKALKEVSDDVFERIEHAADNDGRDGGKVRNVYEGYWDRHDGKDHAKQLAVSAFQEFVGDHKPDADNLDYDYNLNALASFLVGGTIVDHRWISVGFGNGTVNQLYENLIKANLEKQGSPLNLSLAQEQVNEDLWNRIEALADEAGDEDGIVDVLKGNWERHSGKEDADNIAREAYDEFKSENPPTDDESSQVDPDSDFDGELNAVAAALAAGTSSSGTVTPFTNSNIRDHYANLIYLELEKQAENGDPIDLNKAFEQVKKDVYGRLPNALRDDDNAGDKMDALDDYWDDGEGKSDASKIAREAYNQYLADTTDTNNTSYEDNLNSLALGIGGSTIHSTRKLTPLRDPTLGALYQNMVEINMRDGLSLDESIEKANNDLFGRLPHAMRNHDDGDDKIDIVEGYWDRHGGEKDATRLGEAAYREYAQEVSEDNLLAPSATDIMNAETVGGKTVSELYLEKLRAAYGDEPEESDKAKYLRFVEAQIMLGGGYDYLPYSHSTDTNEMFFSSETDSITPEEAAGLLNEEKLKEEFAILAENEEIAEENDRFLREAVNEIKDKQGLEDRIVDTMLAPGYEESLESLDDEGMQRFASDLRSLSLLNPDKAMEVQQELSFGAAFKELSAIFEDPEQLKEVDLDIVSRDVAFTFVRSAVLGFYGADAGAQLYSTFQQYIEGKKLENLKTDGGKILTPEQKNLLIEAKATHETVKSMVYEALKGAIGDNPLAFSKTNWWKSVEKYFQGDLGDKIKQAMDKAYVPEEHRSSVTKYINKMNASGTMTTAGGVACLVAATMILTKDGGENLTVGEQLGAAFNLLWAGSGIATAANQITGGLEKLLKRPGMKEAIGLDKNFKNVWPTDGTTKPELAKIMKDLNKSVQASSGSKALDAYYKLPEDVRLDVSKNIDRLANSHGLKGMSMADKVKLIGPGLKVLGNTAYFAGSVLGIYMGVDGLIKAESDIERAVAGLGLGAGIAWTAASAISLAGVFGATFAGASALSYGLGAAGVILSVIALGITSAIQYSKQKEARQDMEDFFNQLSQDGVTQGDWGTKLDYMANTSYFYEYSRVTDEWYDVYFPEGMAPWEAQPEQYEAFVEKYDEDGGTDFSWWGHNRAEGEGFEKLKPHGDVPDDLVYIPPLGTIDGPDIHH